MRFAALYDIHGNLPALEAVLHEVLAANVEHIVVGGDVVPGPMPRETIACLLSLEIPVEFIRGNGESAVLAEMSGQHPGVPPPFREVIRWNAQQLQSSHQKLLTAWPLTLRLERHRLGQVLFCHATPRDDNEVFTRLTLEERLRPIFDGVDADLVVCGHTHMQFDRMIGTTRIVNAGSVGMPFGKPGAYWLLLDDMIELRCTAYDFVSASERIRSTDYPQAQDFAARNVLQPPSEEQMLEVFEQARSARDWTRVD